MPAISPAGTYTPAPSTSPRMNRKSPVVVTVRRSVGCSSVLVIPLR